MTKISLQEAVQRQPYPDYQKWWTLGARFVAAMAGSIVAEWQAIDAAGDLERVAGHVARYVRLVYGREARPSLVDDFAGQRRRDSFHSGEFDALSYAFFRDAFERLARTSSGAEQLVSARREFTRRVGRRFFRQVAGELSLDIPRQLAGVDDLRRLQRAIQQVGGFLVAEGYLHHHFAFRFDVAASRGGQPLAQNETDFLPALRDGGVAYALYEMGYPIILPSAVYLYQTLGEAQHHSSRTIEELFARCGCRASETDDFDPSGHPSNLVVELWEIRRADQLSVSREQ